MCSSSCVWSLQEHLLGSEEHLLGGGGSLGSKEQCSDADSDAEPKIDESLKQAIFRKLVTIT